MTKKIILASSILAVAVLIASAIILIKPVDTEAALIGSDKIGAGCKTVCIPTYSDSDGWESNCFVDCPNSN